MCDAVLVIVWVDRYVGRQAGMYMNMYIHIYIYMYVYMCNCRYICIGTWMLGAKAASTSRGKVWAFGANPKDFLLRP